MNTVPPGLSSSSKPRRFIDSNYFEADLFLALDDTLFDMSEGDIRWEFCPLQKSASPVLFPTEQWEGGDGKFVRPVHQDPLCGSVLWDAEAQRYALWYRFHNRSMASEAYFDRGASTFATNHEREGSGLCFAHSSDGIHWEKPNLNAVYYRGSYENNMVPDAPQPVVSAHVCGVVPNHLDDGNPELVATTFSKFADPIYPTGITHMHSADGVHWRPHYPPPLPLDGDAHSLMWDPRSQCYLCTTRSAQHSRIYRRLRERGLTEFREKRHIALAKSRDLVHWTPMLDILETDSTDSDRAEIYSMVILPYGNLYIGFMEMFYPSENMTYGPLDVQLAISYDLEKWHRAGQRQAFVPRGSEGCWDSSHVTACPSPPFIEGESLRFFYGGKDTEHWQAGNAALGTGTLRRDGFACWAAGPEGGSVTTVPLRLHWATWPQLNVEAENGEVLVEILGENGEPIEGCTKEDCQSITGNHQRAQVAFGRRRGNFIRHAGLVRFRFHLRNAKLYAFRAQNAYKLEKNPSKLDHQWL
jgi:hypothetical protein